MSPGRRAPFVGRTHLNQGDVARKVSFAIETLGFPQKHGDVIGVSLLRRAAGIGADKKGIELKDAFKRRIGVRRGAFRVEMMNADAAKFARAAAPAQRLDQARGGVGRRADMNVIAGADSPDGFVRRDGLNGICSHGHPFFMGCYGPNALPIVKDTEKD
jgi:hypothetical protein